MPEVTTAFLCRTNAPLVKAAFDLLSCAAAAGKRAQIQLVGRDVAKKLKDVIGEIIGRKHRVDIEDFFYMLDDWLGEINRKHGYDEKKESFVSECEDLYACLIAIGNGCDNVKQLVDKIDSYFVGDDEVQDDPNIIVFCSGHRSKGLEWDTVYILRPDLCPHPSAQTEEELRQEDNIWYVMLTRAKRRLIICHDDI